MLSGHKREGKKLLYGYLFANYSIFSVDTVWQGSIENPIWRIHMIAIMERGFVVISQNVST